MKKTHSLFLLLLSLNIFAQNGTGLIIEPIDRTNILETLDFGSGEESVINKTYPLAMDLSFDMPRAGHQGKTETCVGWAISYGLNTYLEKTRNKWTLSDVFGNDITDRLFSPSDIFSTLGTCNKGITFRKAIDFYANKGTVTLQDSPFQDSQICFSPSINPIRRFLIPLSAEVFIEQEKPFHENIFKDFINNKKPIVIGVMLDDWIRDSNNYNKGIFKTQAFVWSKFQGSCGDKCFHAMVCVGYDDSLQTPNGNIGAFKVLNSWGSEFGNNGYVWIPYSVMKDIIKLMVTPTTLSSINFDTVSFLANSDSAQPLVNTEQEKQESWIAKEQKNVVYYNNFENLRVVLTRLNKSQNEALFSIYDDSGKVKYGDISLNPNEYSAFEINGQKYKLTLKDFSYLKANIFRPEANYKIEKQ